MTMAASNHCPMMTAPVTAIAIKALMFKLRFASAIQPFIRTHAAHGDGYNDKAMTGQLVSLGAYPGNHFR